MVCEVIRLLVINNYFLGNIAESTQFYGGKRVTHSMEQKLTHLFLNNLFRRVQLPNKARIVYNAHCECKTQHVHSFLQNVT
jgi:hypothetical protein